MKDDRKIAFIIAVNNRTVFEECRKYLERLVLPEGFRMEIIPVEGAASMTAAYNEGMGQSDAKYKVYIHQDVFLIDVNCIQAMVRIFEENAEIGMLGVLGGTKLPKNGIAFNMWNAGRTRADNASRCMDLELSRAEGKDFEYVEAVDGMFMATQYDVEWREDLFREWDFYDISQAFEFRRKGYNVAVARQEKTWCLHDCGLSKLERYDYNRQIFLKEYQDILGTYQKDDISVCCEEERVLLRKLEDKMIELLEDGQYSIIKGCIEQNQKVFGRSTRLRIIENMIQIAELEKVKEVPNSFFQSKSWQEIYENYQYIKYALREMEYNFPEEELREFVEKVRTKEISVYAIVVIIEHHLLIKENVWNKIEEICRGV